MQHLKVTLIILVVVLVTACSNAPLAVADGQQTHSAFQRIYEPFGFLARGTVHPAIFVANASSHSVTAYLESDNGDVVPQVFISGAQTGIEGDIDLALDANGRLYVSGQTFPSDSAAVIVFGRGANGFATPIALISCPAANTNYPGISVNADGKIFVTNGMTAGAVTIFGPQSNGCVNSPPQITGPNTGLAAPIGIARGAFGRLFVANAGIPSITEYARGSLGDVTPVRTISGPDTKLIAPISVAVDGRGRVYAVDAVALSINVYGPNANGDAQPIARIHGPHTALYNPFGLAVSTSGAIFESDELTNALHVYPPNADGDVAPIQTIAGPNTGLSDPAGVALYEP